MTRNNFEQKALELFERVLEQKNLKGFQGQLKENRIVLSSQVYFQFGDLRIDKPDKHIVIEVESAGNVTNLVKYWYCLEKQLITKPVFLLHLYRQSSKNDYDSHLRLWSFFCEQMHQQFGIKFKAELFTYHSNSIKEDLQKAVDLFSQLVS